MSETRQTFASLAQREKGLWYALTAVSILVFAWGSARLVANRRSRGEDAVKTSRAESRIRVREFSELVLESLEPEAVVASGAETA